jgi:acyl-[acyl carrier protein]--UDP-N-acetylglucosamine O-acyltransferase
VRRAYQALFLDAGVFRDRLARVEREFANDPLVGKILAFIHAGQSRPLMHPPVSGSPGAGNTDAAP